MGTPQAVLTIEAGPRTFAQLDIDGALTAVRELLEPAGAVAFLSYDEADD